MKFRNTYTFIKPTLVELIEEIDLHKSTIEFFNSRKDLNKNHIKYEFEIEELKDSTWRGKLTIYYEN